MPEVAATEDGRTGAGDDFLGVGRSFTGKCWRVRLADERLGMALAQRLALPEIIGRVLAGRGIGPEEAESFLNPTLKALLPDPCHLIDMASAADRLARAVMAGEGIAVFGDYDVDGATSSALLYRFLSAVGAPPRIYIPDRLKEGYGPNERALLRLKSEGAAIVVTVDCGTTAFQPLEAAAEAGLEVIVVDHHISEPRLPPAYAVINPNRLDESSPHGQLAAVGVAYLLVIAVNRCLREAGWYGPKRPEPELMQWLDLVALGTVCDVAPMTGVNRALVAQGLKVMARRTNPGLVALADVAGLDERPGTYHAGFIFGPRINAGGRVGKSDLGARLLSTEDPVQALALARRLDAYNDERRQLEAAVLEAALAQLGAQAGDSSPLVMAVGKNWHPGVIGIVANRLAERFNRPACVVALADGVGKGSGRSIAGISLGTAVIAARQAGLLIDGGGHAMAAGFTVAEERLDEFRSFLEERLTAQVGPEGIVPSLAIDGALSLDAAKPDFVSVLERLAPFGVGNAEPVFAFAGARVAKADVVGSGHVRCFLTDAGGGRLTAMAFRSADTDLGRALVQSCGAALHIAGRVRADNFRGREGVKLVIDDAAPAHHTAPAGGAARAS